MEISCLDHELKFINKAGLGLNIEERLKIEMGFNSITDKFDLDQVLLWGKVCGIHSDYYVLLGLRMRGTRSFPQKTYFWCDKAFHWGQLPEPKDAACLSALQSHPFSGQYEQVVASDQGQDYTELDRLALVVRQIENDCAAVPVGAFKITPTQEVRYNDHFAGLQVDQLAQLNSYQHFREPQSQAKKEMILSNENIFQLNFLDALEDDLPKDCWSVQQDSNPTEVTLRSLLWPGYVAYHRSNSKVFGRLYIGSGIKTADLPFII